MSVSSIIRDRVARAFPWMYGTSTKHDYGRDFGWKECPEFQDFWQCYNRNSLANAVVDKTITKTWQEMPAIWENEKPSDTADETAIARRFKDRNIWRAMMQTDLRSIVGAYAAAIIIVRDGLTLDEPVGQLSSIDDLVAIIPAWEVQLQVSDWDTDTMSETYAEPLMYQFTEFQMENKQGKPQTVTRIHPSRVLIWSDDGTVNCRSDLEPCFNDLVDAEKIRGAGGEGFWKTSRGAPIITAPQGMSYKDLQHAMGGKTPEETKNALDEKLDDFQSGYDKGLMLGGMDAKPMTITLPQPKEFWEICVQSIAATYGMPFKELIGNVTGERASTEDARAWAQKCMSRRENRAIPVINEMIRRFVAWGMLPDKEWRVGWASLTDASPEEKMALGVQMATIQKGLTELVYLPDEIRETTGFAPSDEIDGWQEYEAEQTEQTEQDIEDAQAGMASDDTGANDVPGQS